MHSSIQDPSVLVSQYVYIDGINIHSINISQTNGMYCTVLGIN